MADRNESMEISLLRVEQTDHPQHEFDIQKIASAFSINAKLVRYYVSLVNSFSDMEAEALQYAQMNQNDAAYWSSMLRQLEEHRKSSRLNLP